MRINALPFGDGLAWLRDGWRLFRRQPLGLPAMVVIYFGMLVVPALLGVIGVAISGVLAPFASVGLLNACRQVAAGQPPLPTAFAGPFSAGPHRLPLFRLGLFNATALLAIAVISVAILPEEATAPATLEDLDPTALLVQLLLYLPLMAVMWFAPVLAGWYGTPPGKAMFGSLFACWRNVGPMIAFGLGAAVLTLGVSLAAVTVLGALLPSRAILSALVAPIALVLVTIVQAGFYPMVRAVFGDETAPGPAGCPARAPAPATPG